jgi:hypothetical protein
MEHVTYPEWVVVEIKPQTQSIFLVVKGLRLTKEQDRDFNKFHYEENTDGRNILANTVHIQQGDACDPGVFTYASTYESEEAAKEAVDKLVE